MIIAKTNKSAIPPFPGRYNNKELTTAQIEWFSRWNPILKPAATAQMMGIKVTELTVVAKRIETKDWKEAHHDC